MLCLYGKRLSLPLKTNMKKKGFSMIELIVTISVITLVTGIFIANYKSNNRRTDLIMTAQKLVADVRLAQNYSLGLARYGGSTSTNVPLGGWGIHFDLNSYGDNKYVIFADDDGDGLYDVGEADPALGARISVLSADIRIKEMSIGSLADVIFLPPDPVTTITNSVSTFDDLLIVLEDINSGAIKTVKVNFLGLVEVLD